MKSIRHFTVLGALLCPLAVVMASNGCKKDEEEPPPPVPTPVEPAPTPTPAPIATMMPEEDAGAEDAAADADADAGKKPAAVGDPSGIRACCQALRQNAKSAPPEQQGAYLAAASACDGLANSPQGRQALAGLRSILLGAQLPASCK